MVDLAAGTHLAFLHLHKVADAATIGDLGCWTQMSKGSDGNAIAHRGLPDNGMQHGNVVAELGIFQQAAGSQAAVVADAAATAQMGLRFDHHIATEAAVFTEGAAAGVDEGDALRHPVVAQALLQDGFTLGELLAVVDAVHLIGIGDFNVHGLWQHRHRVRQVELPLVVVGAQLRQDLRQRLPVEAIDAGVGEVVAALLLGAVAMLNDGAHLPIGIDKHPAIARRVLQACRQQRDIGSALAVAIHQRFNRFCPQQGHVAVEHQQFTLKSLQHRQQLLHGMAGAVLGLLQHEFESADGC